MSTFTIVMLVILIVLIIACIVLYFLGKRAEKKQAEQQEQLAAVAQTVSMLIIDKGQLRLKDAGLPQSFWRIRPSISAVPRFLSSKRRSALRS